MYKNIIVTLAALTCLLTAVACVEDPTCHDPEGFQGEFGCVYDDDGDTTGIEELKTVKQAGAVRSGGNCWRCLQSSGGNQYL